MPPKWLETVYKGCVGGVNSDRSQRFATEEVDLELLEYVFLGRVV